MLKNKKGSLGLAILGSLFCLIVGLMLVNFLMPEITQFRTDMSCADASAIHDGVKILCLISSATIPYWIVIVFSLVIGGITARLSL